MCQRFNTGESNNFYVGIFICIGPLSLRKKRKLVGCWFGVWGV